MGMAASQARFLSLTARKSNVEYEGQQINQERTALANESSNLYSQLSKMDVPTPPNTSDFYKTVYTFTSNQLSEDGSSVQYTVDSDIINTPDGDKIKASYKTPVIQGSAVNLNIFGDDEKVDTTDINDPSKQALKDTLTKTQIENYVGTVMVNDKPVVVYGISKDDNANTLDFLTKENEKLTEGDQLYYYNDPATNARVFINPMAEGADDWKVDTALKVAQVGVTVSEELDVKTYQHNELGRLTSVTVKTGTDKNDEPVYTTFELECTTVQDEEAYAQAMLDYEYEQAKYERNVADLNAKTEQIQEKDKTLELELKQLDTEQNAISTEMDAVTKVVEDNIESTFKTFA